MSGARRFGIGRAMFAAGAVIVSALASNWPLAGPREPRAFSLVNHALALTDAGRFAEAEAEAERAIAMIAGAARVLGGSGPPSAPGPAGALAMPDADEVDARLARAFALAELGRLDEAFSEYQRAAAGDPSHGPSHRGVGDVLLRLGRADEAIGPLQRAVELDARDAVALNLLGAALGQSGRGDEAAEVLARSLALDPGRPGAWLNLGNALLGAGRTAEAVTAYQRALGLDLRLADAAHNLGVAHAQRREWREAAAAFARALELDPSRADSRAAVEEVKRLSAGAPRQQ